MKKLMKSYAKNILKELKQLNNNDLSSLSTLELILKKIHIDAAIENLKLRSIIFLTVPLLVAQITLITTILSEQAKLFLASIIFFVVAFLLLEIRNILQAISEATTCSKIIETKLEIRKAYQEKIDLAYEEALIFKEKMATDIKKSKVLSAKRRDKCLKSKYLSN